MIASAPDSTAAVVYRIVVRGYLTDRLASSFDGMALEPGDATSALTGPVRDQAQLMGVLRGLDGLGIELVSVTPAPREKA